MKLRPRLLVALVTSIVLAGCSTPPPAVGTGSHFKGPVGLQLYSLRAQFTRNVPATVKTVQDFGSLGDPDWSWMGSMPTRG